MPSISPVIRPVRISHSAVNIPPMIDGKLAIKSSASCPNVLNSCGRSSPILGMIVVRNSFILLPKSESIPGRLVHRLFNSSCIFAFKSVNSSGILVSSATLNCSHISPAFACMSGSIATIASGIPFMMFHTAGNMFCAMLINVVPRFWICWVISLPKTRFAFKSDHAALNELTEPIIVLLASSADVPVIPNSPWITWIALYTSDKLEIS